MGELTVIGDDEIVIELPGDPDFVCVGFTDDLVPCVPGTDDELCYKVRKVCKKDCRSCYCLHRNSWILVIKWKVAGSRKISWEVFV